MGQRQALLDAVEAAREAGRLAVRERALLQEQCEQRMLGTQERVRLTRDLLEELAHGAGGGRYRT